MGSDWELIAGCYRGWTEFKNGAGLWSKGVFDIETRMQQVVHIISFKSFLKPCIYITQTQQEKYIKWKIDHHSVIVSDYFASASN